jgi:hypothetical protein
MFTVSLNTDVYEAGTGNVLAFYDLGNNPAVAALFESPEAFPNSLKLKNSNGDCSPEFHGSAKLFTKSEVDNIVSALSHSMRVFNLDNRQSPCNRPYDRVIVCSGTFTPGENTAEMFSPNYHPQDSDAYNREMEQDFPEDREDRELTQLTLGGVWGHHEYVRFDEEEDDEEEEDEDEEDEDEEDEEDEEGESE